MKKGNIIDLKPYQEQKTLQRQSNPQKNNISHELEDAIELLIQRLRELGPIQKAN